MGMKCHAVWYKYTNISEEPTTLIFSLASPILKLRQQTTPKLVYLTHCIQCHHHENLKSCKSHEVRSIY
jgi:hypothetical protein